MRGYTRIECVGRYPAPGGSFLPAKNAIGWERGHMHCYFSFLRALAQGKTPAPGLEEGARLQRLLDCMAASAAQHSWVTVD